MGDDQRVYSDEEFALVLRTAADLASRAEQPGLSSGGLTLAEMKSAAAQAGFDPALVERAARQLVTPTVSTPFERLVGGPLRHEQEIRFATRLDERNTARLLSAMRINTHFHSSDPGHSSALGMTWSAASEGDVLRVAARPDTNGTTVSVILDRRGTFVVAGGLSLLVMFFAVLFSVYALAPESLAQGIGGLVVGIGGVLTIARSFWASSTRRAREKLAGIVDTIGHTLSDGT